MKWFRADRAFGFEDVDKDKGIIKGVALNTEGIAKGHGVFLDKEFVEEVTKQGKALKKGLKSRFGHPNMSSTAFGTYIGRYKNFRTTYKEDGTAVARADLHLSEVAKKAPSGDLYEYVLDMAEKEPDMFGTSIVFTPGNLYRKNKEGKKAIYHSTWTRNGLEVWYTWESGETLSKDEEKELSEEIYVELKKLHANDVVDEPAANPDGLFSAFSKEMTAAKVTEFLDENPEVLQLFNNDEIRTSFMARYESYKKEKIEMEAFKMGKENKGGEASEKKKGFKDRLFNWLSDNGFGEGGAASKTTPEEKPESKFSEEEFNKQLNEANAKITSLEADVQKKVEELSKKDEELSEKDEQLSESVGLLKEAKEQLSALGGGLEEEGGVKPNKSKFKTYEEALAFQMDEKDMSFEEADKYCEEHYMHLYPQD